MTPLEELFSDEDAQKVTPQQNSMPIQDQVEKELHMYKAMPRIVTSDDAAAYCSQPLCDVQNTDLIALETSADKSRGGKKRDKGKGFVSSKTSLWVKILHLF
ncbi:hypothetical protein NQZ68_031915 [Dissostichus eleginoides]|nr:hypothetical protein NQZ68_031915 [Dissostichus eleginoides]